MTPQRLVHVAFNRYLVFILKFSSAMENIVYIETSLI